jgi:hypothetical protein
MYPKTAKDVCSLEEDLAQIGLSVPTTVAEPLEEGSKPKKYKRRGSSSGSLASGYARHVKGLREDVEVEDTSESEDAADDQETAGVTQEAEELASEVDALLANFEESENNEIVRSFAYTAVVADVLSERFAEIAEALAQDEDVDEEMLEGFQGLSEEFSALAEDAAGKAESLSATLQEGAFDEVDVSVVESDFHEMMSALLDGLDVYGDVVEADDEEEDSEESDEEEDSEDDSEEEKPSKDKKKSKKEC